MPAVRGTTEAVSSVKDQLTGQLHRVRQQTYVWVPSPQNPDKPTLEKQKRF